MVAGGIDTGANGIQHHTATKTTEILIEGGSAWQFNKELPRHYSGLSYRSATIGGKLFMIGMI